MKYFQNISGSQRGKTKIKELFKNIDGYIIMFDVSRGETFDNVIGWKKNIDTVNNPNKLPSLLLANKVCLIKNFFIELNSCFFSSSVIQKKMKVYKI